MTPDERQALEALIAKWRAVAETRSSNDSLGWDVCADELAEALGRLTPEEKP
jgi:hypothetical protein